MNYFDFFNLKFSYSIDLNLLINSYQKLQKKYHPDLFINKNKNSIDKAIKKSAFINQAFRILKDPFLRAKYILNLKKINIENKKYQINNSSFLNKNLKIYEELEYIKKNKNMKKRIIKIDSNLKKTKKKYIKKIEKELNLKEWENAAKIINKLHFINKIEEKINKYKTNIFKEF